MAAECWPSARRRQFACFPHDSCAVANRCCRLIEEVPQSLQAAHFLTFLRRKSSGMDYSKLGLRDRAPSLRGRSFSRRNGKEMNHEKSDWFDLPQLATDVDVRLLPLRGKICRPALMRPRLFLTRSWARTTKRFRANILKSATCVAVVPGMVKGAFLVGAQYGQGVVTCRTGHGWSGPVFIRMAGGSFGFQIGGQATDLILVAVNERGLQDLLQDKFKIGGDASAAAGPVGRAGTASTDWKMNAELLSYSRTKGIVCRHRSGRHEREPESRRYRDLLRRAASLR